MERTDQDFISQMLQETKIDPESNVISMPKHEQSKDEFPDLLKDLALTSDSYFFELDFLPQTQMFRFHLKGEVIDIPANWSFFCDLYEGMKSGEFKSITIGLNDDDGLVEALSQFWSQISEFTFISYKSKIYFVASEEGKSFATLLSQQTYLSHQYPYKVA